MPEPIALKLRDLRAARGLTQRQAAELARVSPQTLMDLESGKRPPYMPTLTKIARGYGVPLEELVKEE
jgi:transcriptional regulator with XRE-family HTH domain